jgi:hypothetical protein
MLTWQQLRCLSDDKLERQDVLFVNIACGEGVPGVPFIDEGQCETRLRDILAVVKLWTKLRYELFQTEPERFDHCWDRYRMACMVAVLQWQFNMLRDPEWTFEDGADTARNTPPNHHLFAHHLMRGGLGSCASLPIVFCSVGRRLGYPLKLVLTKRHMFLRWDDASSGNRFNIECTSHGFDTSPDEYYRTWPEESSDEEIARHGWLRSLTPREELAAFLEQRRFCFWRSSAERDSASVRSGTSVLLGLRASAAGPQAWDFFGSHTSAEVEALFRGPKR